MTIPKQLQALFIDLDDTLYECPEISHQVAENIRGYMVSRLGVKQEEVHGLCRELYHTFGTTLAGLVAHGHAIDYDEWHDAIHATLPYDSLLKPDPKMKQLLNSIPLPKWIFTNADEKHARRCLDILGLADCFQGIICFESVMAAAAPALNSTVVCKPSHKAMELALHQAGGLSAVQVAFFDDSVRNIASAYHNGVYSVLVGRAGQDTRIEETHQCVASMRDLPTHLPWLWHVDMEQEVMGSPRGEEQSNRVAITVQA